MVGQIVIRISNQQASQEQALWALFERSHNQAQRADLTSLRGEELQGPLGLEMKK
jgi:hypothetical protein